MIEMSISERRRDLGGFEVGRVLPFAKRRMVGPFVFFDHMGPIDLVAGLPRSVDVRPHPHIGLETVTYLFAGEIMHRDSVGSEQPIRAGEVNWMTAGRGITHSERFEYARMHGDFLHGIQAWVALPTEREEMEPSFAHHEAADLPAWEEGHVRSRLIAGDAFGLRATVKIQSPLFYIHAAMPRGTRTVVPNHYSERAAHVSVGRVEIGGRIFGTGEMIVFNQGADAAVLALEPATVMLIGGEPLGERFIDWNFVSSSRERIEQAKADWSAGRMKLPDLDHEEFALYPVK